MENRLCDRVWAISWARCWEKWMSEDFITNEATYLLGNIKLASRYGDLTRKILG
jgi:hypothetical protein